MISSYTFTKDIPKSKIFVKLAKDIAQDRKDYIANGIRSFFRDDATILLDTGETLKSINGSIFMF
jgi:DeoR/GlpR family transcriptional regulator of sugar metabolism